MLQWWSRQMTDECPACIGTKIISYGFWSGYHSAGQTQRSAIIYFNKDGKDLPLPYSNKGTSYKVTFYEYPPFVNHVY